MTEKQMIEVAVEIPDRVTVFIHNHNLMVKLFWLCAGLALLCAITDKPLYTAFLTCLCAVCSLVKFLICGWVHSFVAYAQAVSDPRIQVTVE